MCAGDGRPTREHASGPPHAPLPLPLPQYVGEAPPAQLPRLTSDGGSAADDAAANRALPAGSGAPHAAASGKGYLPPDQLDALRAAAKSHSQEYVRAMEIALLEGKSVAQAAEAAGKAWA